MIYFRKKNRWNRKIRNRSAEPAVDILQLSWIIQKANSKCDFIKIPFSFRVRRVMWMCTSCENASHSDIDVNFEQTNEGYGFDSTSPIFSHSHCILCFWICFCLNRSVFERKLLSLYVLIGNFAQCKHICCCCTIVASFEWNGRMMLDWSAMKTSNQTHNRID